MLRKTRNLAELARFRNVSSSCVTACIMSCTNGAAPLHCVSKYRITRPVDSAGGVTCDSVVPRTMWRFTCMLLM